MIKRRQFVVGRGLRLLLATVLIIIDKSLAKSLSGRGKYSASGIGKFLRERELATNAVQTPVKRGAARFFFPQRSRKRRMSARGKKRSGHFHRKVQSNIPTLNQYVEYVPNLHCCAQIALRMSSKNGVLRCCTHCAAYKYMAADQVCQSLPLGLPVCA